MVCTQGAPGHTGACDETCAPAGSLGKAGLHQSKTGGAVAALSQTALLTAPKAATTAVRNAWPISVFHLQPTDFPSKGVQSSAFKKPALCSGFRCTPCHQNFIFTTQTGQLHSLEVHNRFCGKIFSASFWSFLCHLLHLVTNTWIFFYVHVHSSEGVLYNDTCYQSEQELFRRQGPL